MSQKRLKGSTSHNREKVPVLLALSGQKSCILLPPTAAAQLPWHNRREQL